MELAFLLTKKTQLNFQETFTKIIQTPILIY